MTEIRLIPSPPRTAVVWWRSWQTKDAARRPPAQHPGQSRYTRHTFSCSGRQILTRHFPVSPAPGGQIFDLNVEDGTINCTAGSDCPRMSDGPRYTCGLAGLCTDNSTTGTDQPFRSEVY